MSFLSLVLSNRALRVLKTLTFKMRPSAQPFMRKWVLFASEWKIISISKAEHLTSFWYRGPGELGNGLLFVVTCFLLCYLAPMLQSQPSTRSLTARSSLAQQPRKTSSSFRCGYSFRFPGERVTYNRQVSSNSEGNLEYLNRCLLDKEISFDHNNKWIWEI